jgi:hypothetical protein
MALPTQVICQKWGQNRFVFDENSRVWEFYLMESRNIAELEKQVEELTRLCQEINPFAPLSDKEGAILRDLAINPEDGPYAITNALIFRLENSIEELQTLRGIKQ